MLLTIKFHSHSSGPNQIRPLILPSIKNIERLCYKYLFHDLNHSTGPLRSFQRSAEIETILFVRFKTCKVSQMRLSYFFFNADEFGAHDSIVLDRVLSCKIFYIWRIRWEPAVKSLKMTSPSVSLLILFSLLVRQKCHVEQNLLSLFFFWLVWDGLFVHA